MGRRTLKRRRNFLEEKNGRRTKRQEAGLQSPTVDPASNHDHYWAKMKLQHLFVSHLFISRAIDGFVPQTRHICGLFSAVLKHKR